MFNAVFNFSDQAAAAVQLPGGRRPGADSLAGEWSTSPCRFVTDPPRGLTTVLLLLLMNLGVLSLGIGILGEYIGKIYAESKRRPLWLVDYTLNWMAVGAAAQRLTGGRQRRAGHVPARRLNRR